MANLEETPRQTQGGGGGILSLISPWDAMAFPLRSWGRWLRGGWPWHSFLTSLAPQPGL